MALEKKVIEEAGPWQQIIAPLFDEIILGDTSLVDRAEVVLDILKRTKSAKCYREYQHLYNNILNVVTLTKELKEKYPDSHQDGGTSGVSG